jgi:hypothetical protein
VSAIRSRRLTAILVAVVAWAFAGALVPPSADAAAPRDTVTSGGYHFSSDRPADVYAGMAAVNIVFRYVAARALTDGTIILDLPTADWPTPLRAGGGLSGDPSENGTVVLRPDAPAGFTPGPGDCTGSGPDGPHIAVLETSSQHRVLVQHLSCAVGQQVAIRIYGIQAPAVAGRYPYAISVSDTGGAHRVSAPAIKVVAPPRIRLEVTVPATPQVNAPTPVLVRALKPNGKVDAGYRGGVALLSENNHDCSFEGYEDDIYDFTAADAGTHVITVTFAFFASHELLAYDVANQALPGESEPYQVVGDITGVDCPVSYH